MMRELITFPIIIIIKIHHDHNNHNHNSHLMRELITIILIISCDCYDHDGFFMNQNHNGHLMGELIAGSISIHRREKDPGRSGWVDWRFFHEFLYESSFDHQ